MDDVLRIKLLGGFRVSVGSLTVDEGRWRLKKAAGLVKLLASNRPSDDLTGREEEIFEHTAATHVRRILRKLDLASRSQIVAWATERRLTPETDRTDG